MPMMGYGFGFGWIVMLLFWVFIIAGTVWLVLALARSQSRPPSAGDTAFRILQERLARGEIDIEEFKARRAALEETRH
jgi:putative membrane protein